MLQNQAYSASVASRLKWNLSKKKALHLLMKKERLASPDFPVLNDSWVFVPVGFFEDLSCNELANLNSLTN